MLALNNGGYVNYIDYFLSLFERWNWHDAPEVGDIYREFQFRFPEYSTLFPDAVDTLKALRNKGYLLGIITNGPSVLQNRKLDVCALRPLVDLCVVSGDENLHKPDPEIFRRPPPAWAWAAITACMWVIIRSTISRAPAGLACVRFISTPSTAPSIPKMSPKSTPCPN